MPLVEADRQGDLVLELTKNGDSLGDRSTSILVSSKVLTLASPVFSAMLSPRFREGQRSASGKLDPIQLPEDDAAAMETLCHIFHFNYSALPAKVDMELFKNLALICDKYDCVAPLRFISEQWLLIWEKAAKEEELETLLFISYMFDCPERFAALSARIVKEFIGNLKQLETLGKFDALPYVMLRGLNQQRKETLREIESSIARRLELMEQLSTLSFPMPNSPGHCLKCWKCPALPADHCTRCRSTLAPMMCSLESRRGRYVEVLKKSGLNPVRLWASMGAKSIIEIAKNISAAQEAIGSHSCVGTELHCPLIMALRDLKTDADKLVEHTKGLCLDCVKAGQDTPGLGATPPAGSNCRVSHG